VEEEVGFIPPKLADPLKEYIREKNQAPRENFLRKRNGSKIKSPELGQNPLAGTEGQPGKSLSGTRQI